MGQWLRRQTRPRRLPAIRVALAAAVCALLLQCLAPPGYMAGSLRSGWPVVLCPEGLPAGFLGQDHDHHRAADAGAGTGQHDLSGHCQLGNVLDGSVASLPVFHAGPLTAAGGYASPGYLPPALPTLYRNHPSRAPPLPV